MQKHLNYKKFIFLLYLFPLATIAQTADTIFYNGKILTVDKDFSIEEAVAISEDRILSVGSSDDILQMSSVNTRLINLEGKTIVSKRFNSKVIDEYLDLTKLSQGLYFLKITENNRQRIERFAVFN